jgi:hypothetical protein
MSMEVLREWAQTDEWTDLMRIFEDEIHTRSTYALAVARTGNAQHQVGISDGLSVGLDILKRLRRPDAESNKS